MTTNFTYRRIWTRVLLSIITFGIYSWIWMYKLSKDMVENNIDDGLNPKLVVLLSIVTLDVYGYYWSYRMGCNIDDARVTKGKKYADNSLLYLILAFCRLQIIGIALMQYELNLIAKERTQH